MFDGVGFDTIETRAPIPLHPTLTPNPKPKPGYGSDPTHAFLKIWRN